MADTVISLRDQRPMSSEQLREKTRVSVSATSPAAGTLEANRLVVGADVIDGRRVPVGPLRPVPVQRVDSVTGEVTTVGVAPAVATEAVTAATTQTASAAAPSVPTAVSPRVSVSSPFGLVPLPVKSLAMSSSVLHLFFASADAARLQVPTAGPDAPLELDVDGTPVRCVSGSWSCQVGADVMYTFLVV